MASSKNTTSGRIGSGSAKGLPEQVPDHAKVGSDRSAAEHFAGKRDFGIPAEGAGRFVEVAEEAKYQPAGDHHSDPRPPRRDGVSPVETGDDAATGEISQGEASGDDNTDIDNLS